MVYLTTRVYLFYKPSQISDKITRSDYPLTGEATLGGVPTPPESLCFCKSSLIFLSWATMCSNSLFLMCTGSCNEAEKKGLQTSSLKIC